MTEKTKDGNNMIYIIGDIHGDCSRLSYTQFPESRNFKEDDEHYVIVLGDMGLLWKDVPDKTELYNIEFLNSRPFTTLYLDGNHENHVRLNALERVDFHGASAGKISDKIYHIRRGSILNLFGKTIFCFGGALSYDRDYRTDGVDYWSELELPSYANKWYAMRQLSDHNYKVDYILTHTLPQYQVQPCRWKQPYVVDDHDPTRLFLDIVRKKTQYKEWHAGHWHFDAKLPQKTWVHYTEAPKKLF